MNASDRRVLEKSMKRVGKQINALEVISGTAQSEQFAEDLKLIIFELWVFLKKDK